MKKTARASTGSGRHHLTVRLTTDAMLVALYFVLARFVSINLPFAQFSVSSVPIILCGFLFGPADALTVSFLGSFLEQALSEYGLSVTTPLWMLPVMLTGLFAGVACRLCRYSPRKWQSVIIVICSELLFTIANTFALYADAQIWGYAIQALAVMIPGRLFTAGVRMVVTVPLLTFLVDPLRLLADKSGQVTARSRYSREKCTLRSGRKNAPDDSDRADE